MHEEVRKDVKKIEKMKMKERMKHIHLMARTKIMCKRDVVGSSYMRTKDGQLKMQLTDKLKILKKYFEKLLNEETL